MANVSLAEEHLDEAVLLLSATTIVATFYTLIVILYCLSVRRSYAQLRDHHGNIKRRTASTLVLQTVLLICATLDVIVNNRHARLAFIDNSTLPGDPLSARLSSATLLKLDGIVNIVEELLILGVLLSRVSVIWSGTHFLIPITALSLFFYLVNAGLAISYRAIIWKSDDTSLAATPQAKSIIFIMASIFSLASLLFMTSAIIARLVFIRQKHIKLMGKSDAAGQYLGIVTMFIESYALDTLWNTGSLVSFGLKYAPTSNLFSNCTIQVDILSNFLVFYRVLSGQAWDRQTENQLSTVNWDPNGASTTTSGTGDLRQTDIMEEDPPVISFRDGV